jgi:Winged helix-turn helix
MMSVRCSRAAGRRGGQPGCETGVLVIPLDEEERPGWIVDSQQRAAAIRDARVERFPIFLYAFITEEIAEQRAQFILVNSTKPLPKGLIHELLPATDAPLPIAKCYFTEVWLRISTGQGRSVAGILSSRVGAMMPRVSPYRIGLSDEERAALESLARSYTLPYWQVTRAQMVLMAAEGLGNDQIAARIGCGRDVVSRWRKRFFEQRLAGLEDQPRRGRPPVFPPSGAR